MSKRVTDQYKSIYSFSNHFLVVCPRCAQCAEVVAADVALKATKARLSCFHCGYTATASLWGWSTGLPKDWYFHRPLWLQIPCKGHTLWALNLEHLNYVSEFIEATVREHRRDQYGCHNGSMLNRLPQWMKNASNRSAVIKAIGKLREKADECRKR